MSQIEELQGRITAAMARIDAGASALAARSQASEPSPDLVQALEDERSANAQLEERLRALTAQHNDEIAALRVDLDQSSEIDGLKSQLDALDQAMGQLDTDLQQLREANGQLRASNAALRAANQEGVGDPDLINEALQADLDGLRTAHAAEIAEVGVVLAKLKPLLADAGVVTEGEDA